MNKTFSKSYIILPLELILDYIVLNYCLLNTICFTYAYKTISSVTSLYDRRFTALNITAQLNQFSEENESKYTVRRRLCEPGLYGRITVKKSQLRKQNNFKRLQWAKAHKNWTIEQ